MKHKLLPELPLMLRNRIASVVDISCGARLEGLQKLSFIIDEVHGQCKLQQQERTVHRFLDLVDQSDVAAAPMICYGEQQTIVALKLGAVEKLLVASSAFQREFPMRERLEELAATSGAIVVEVEPQSQMDVRFCRGFQIGGFLRWPVDPDLLDDTFTEDVHTPIVLRNISDEVESDLESTSTAASKSDNFLLQWLEGALMHTVKDACEAKALAMTAEVILADDSTSVEERLHNTTEVLRAEGVSEEVLLELSLHMSDLSEMGPR